jgi:hypothetical protein
MEQAVTQAAEAKYLYLQQTSFGETSACTDSRAERELPCLWAARIQA